jgi:hypothetical protein
VTVELELPPLRQLSDSKSETIRQYLEATVNSKPSRRKNISVAVVASSLVLFAGSLAAAAALLSKGPIPRLKNGELNLSKAPDYVSVVGSHGHVVGYIPRDDIIDQSAVASPKNVKVVAIEPVYGANLTTVVGHLYPGIGYVAQGKTPKRGICRPILIYSGTKSRSMPCPSTLVVVPNVVGISTPSAAAELSGLNIYVRVIYAYSSSVPAGSVISISPAGGSIVHARSVETITSSRGTAPS